MDPRISVILRGLQMMTEIPFKHEIVHAKQSLPAENIEIPSSMQDRVDKLDPGQRRALEIALNDCVVLIQGPPGTGLFSFSARIFFSSELLLKLASPISLFLTLFRKKLHWCSFD